MSERAALGTCINCHERLTNRARTLVHTSGAQAGKGTCAMNPYGDYMARLDPESVREAILAARAGGAGETGLRAAVEELRLWLDGKRSMTNFIRGSLGGHEGDSETETRLIWEADNAQIIARAALVNAAVALSTQPPAPPADTTATGEGQ